MVVEVGALAPDFTLRDQDGKEVTLSDFRGNKDVVVLFYPLTFTGVCEGELCAVRDDIGNFQNEKAQVLAISVDAPPAHKVWAEQQGYTFPLLSDFWPHGKVAQDYGVFNETAGIATRGTFVVDKNGIVVWMVVNAIPDARDQSEYVKVLNNLA